MRRPSEKDPPAAEHGLAQAALDAVAEGVTICRADGDREAVYVNPAFLRMTGYDCEEVLGRNLRFLQGDDREQSALGPLREALDAGEPVEVVLRNYRRDGSLFHDHLSISPVRDGSGKLTHFIGIQSDVSVQLLLAEHQRLAEQQRAAVDRLKGLYLAHASPQDIFRYALDELLALSQSSYGLISETDASATSSGGLRRLASTTEDMSAEKATQDGVALALRRQGALIGCVELFDRPGGYENAVLDLLQPVADVCAELIASLRLEREREAALRALASEEARYRSLFEHTGTAMAVIDSDGCIKLANHEFARVTGYRREEAIGMRFTDFLSEDEARRLEQRRRLRLRGAVLPQTYQTHLRRVDGARRDGLLTVHAFPENGEIIGSFIDVTEQYRAEQLLREAETRYRLLVEGQTDLIVRLDADGRILLATPSFCRFVGRDEEELLGEQFAPLVSADDDEMTRKLPRLSRPPYRLRLQQRARQAKRSRWLEWELRSEIGSDGSPAAIIAVGRDITERRYGEQMLQIRLRIAERAGRLADDELLIAALDEVCAVCDSPVGFYHTVAPDQKTLMMQAWSTQTSAHFCCAEGAGKHYSIDEAGIWADAVRLRKAVIVNDYAQHPFRRGLPPGHAAVERFMVAPVFQGDRIVAALGVGNKDSDYDTDDLHFVSALADLVWDVGQRRRLEHLSLIDALTELPNRKAFNTQLHHAVERADGERMKLTLAYIDVDHFGSINERLGQAGGDRILRELAKRWREGMQSGAELARIGADEFALILPEDDEEDSGLDAVKQLRELSSTPINIDGEQIRVSISIGLARFPGDAADAEQLLAAAEAAYRMQRRSGQSGVALFDPESSRDAARWFETEIAVRNALDRGELRLRYQPQIELRTGVVTGAEALIRWQRGDRLVPPGEFLDVVEGSDLYAPVGRWVLNEACRQARQWLDRDHPVRVAVNVFAAQVSSGELVQDVRAALARHQLPPRWLELEVVETSVLRDPASAARTLRALTRMGVGLALDDFGTGWSSLIYLKHFPFDVVKIDQVFTRNISRDPTDVSIVRATIELAHSLGMRVLAEGIETAAHLQYLSQYGCDEGQGFLFGRPTLPAHIESFAMRRSDLRPAVVGNEQALGSILLLESDSDQQELLSVIFKQFGYPVLPANDVASAMALLTRERVDLVLADLTCDAAKRIDFLGRARQLFPYIRRIALAMPDSADIVVEAVNVGGVQAIVPKPWDAAMLIDAVRAAMGGPSAPERTRLFELEP